ncbi:MAG: cyclic nucleotide-binding domain-containing protein [Syntrophobacteraceae bacterium]
MTAAHEENREDLLKSPLFRDLPAAKIDEIARAVVVRVAPPGSIIFKEGDPADGFYIVGSGNIRVFVKHEKGIERELAVLGPGESFGEVALLTGETRSANAQALGETRLMVLLKEDFDRLLGEFPELSKKFMKDMRNWLLRDQELIDEEVDVVLQASRLSWYDFLLIIGVSVLLALSFNHSNPNGIPLIPTVSDKDSIPAISAAAAMEEYRRGKSLVVDAMPANFYQKRHIKGAVNMPMALFDIVYLMNFSEENKEREILVYGSTISKPYDYEIASKFLLLGYTDVKVISGGLSAWETMGYPVEGSETK